MSVSYPPHTGDNPDCSIPGLPNKHYCGVNKDTYLYRLIGHKDNYNWFLYLVPLILLFIVAIINLRLLVKTRQIIQRIKTPRYNKHSYNILAVNIFIAVAVTLAFNFLLIGFRFCFFCIGTNFSHYKDPTFTFYYVQIIYQILSSIA